MTRPSRHRSTVHAGVAVITVLVLGAACSSTPSTGSPSDSAAKGTSAPGPTTGSTPGSSPAPIAADPVPASYADLYATLTSGLDAYQRAVDTMPSTPSKTPGVAAAELLPANGNRLQTLLAPATMTGVDAWLDRFRSMGITGVTLGVKLPMLLPQFGPDGERYAAFFATVAEHARARGLTVDVELGALFCGTAYAACTYSFAGSYADFVAATVAQSRIVIDRIKPDYLTLLSEPTTEKTLTGVADFATPAGTARYIHDVLAGIGDRGTTRVGAGAATWLAPTFNEAILRESIDYLVLHIYPVSAQIAQNLVDDTALAVRAGKPIVADEVGLYKTGGNDAGGPATADRVYRLDNFSFFTPLDVRFLDITRQWARRVGVAFVSPFWPSHFFAYVTWTPALDAAPFATVNRTAEQAVSRAFVAGEVTDTGRSWSGGL